MLINQHSDRNTHKRLNGRTFCRKQNILSLHTLVVAIALAIAIPMTQTTIVCVCNGVDGATNANTSVSRRC